MDLTFDGDTVHGGREARERFYDARGYGRPRDGGVELAPVEAAHLLFRGDIDAVRDGRPDSRGDLDFNSLLASAVVSEVDFFVYKELRDRGFYLSPAREHGDEAEGPPVEFLVYPRGNGPWDDTVAYRVVTLSERATIDASTLSHLAHGSADEDEGTAVLAVVDEESEVTYLELTTPAVTGSTYHDLSPFEGRLLSDRVLVSEPPDALHDRAFYGQRLDRDDDPVQLSLVEAAYLERADLLRLGETDGEGAPTVDSRIVDRGREVEGERFNRRLRVYDALRTAGIVPKTGFKFGADFRTYANVESVDNLGHSEFLVRVLPPVHSFVPRDLSLDVRLAHGVRKRMLFALTGEDGIDWLSVERLTP